MARQDLYIIKRGATPIGLEGFVIVLDQYVLLLSLEYAEPSCHYLIDNTLVQACFFDFSLKTQPIQNSEITKIQENFAKTQQIFLQN